MGHATMWGYGMGRARAEQEKREAEAARVAKLQRRGTKPPGPSGPPEPPNRNIKQQPNLTPEQANLYYNNSFVQSDDIPTIAAKPIFEQLLNIVHTNDNSNSYYYIGYKEATLLSSPTTETIKGTAIYINTGNSSAKNIYIYGEELFLLGKMLYLFPNKNVYIFSRTLSIIGNGDAMIAVNGKNGNNGRHRAIEAKETPKKEKKEEKLFFSSSFFNFFGQPESLPQANSGENGFNGGNAGIICINVYNIIIPENSKLHLVACGGNGGNGGDGKNGENGSQLGLVGQQGQKGGDGGKNGAGGNYGNINIIAKNCENINRINVQVASGRCGKAGAAGTGGDGADGFQDWGAWGQNGSVSWEYKQPIVVEAGVFINDPLRWHCFYEIKIPAEFIALVHERLEFEYLANFSDFMSNPNTYAGLDTTLNWLNDIYKFDAEKNVKPNLSLLNAKFKLYMSRMNKKCDFYNNRLNTIPEINPDISAIKVALDHLLVIENAYIDTKSCLLNYKSNIQKINTEYHRVKAAYNTNNDESDAIYAELGPLGTQIDEVHHKLEQQRQIVEKSYNKVKTTISQQWKCNSFTAVLSSLGSVLLFSPSLAIAPGVAIGGVVSALANIDFENADLGSAGSVNKKYLIRRVGEAVDLKTLSSLSESKGLIDDGGSGNQILVNKDKFDSVYREYLADLGGVADELRDNFDKYVEIAQEQNQLIISYNQKYLRLLQMKINADDFAHQVSVIESNMNNMTETKLPLLNNFFTQMYRRSLERVLYLIYVASRACSALTLKPNNVLASLHPLGSMEALNHAVLTSIYSDLHNYTILDVRKTLGSQLRHENTAEIRINASKFPSIFADLKKNNKFTVNIPPIMKDNSDSLYYDFIDKANVRVKDIKVYLLGATSERSKVAIKIKNDGIFHVVDTSNNKYTFFAPNLNMQSEYSYTDATKGPFQDLSRTSALETSMAFTTSTDKYTLESFLRTPYSAWQFSVGKLINVTEVNEILIKFDIKYQNFN